MPTPELTLTFKRLADLDPAERARVDEVDHICFTGGDDLGLEWSTPEWMLCGSVDGTIVAQVGILLREVEAGGETVRVGGVGGVATLPEWRKHGYAQILMSEAARLMREELRVPFGLLACNETMRPYYARLGWRVVPDKVWVTSRGERRSLPDFIMILPLTGRTWPAGEVDLCGKPW